MDLKAYCKERGIKQSRITRLVGIPKDRLCRLVNGKPVNLTILELMKFCKFLGLKPSQATSGYTVFMDSQKFYLKEKAPQGCANIEGLNNITTHSIPQTEESMKCGKTYRMRGYAMVPIDITIPLDEGQDPDDVADNFDDSDYAEFILGSDIHYIIKAEIDEIEEVH